MRARLALLAAVLIAASVGHAHGAEDRREVKGRKLFIRGEYEKALDIYAQLYAEKADPIYLRNVGRCNQKLKRPEKAIDAFREYLRKAHVKPAERDEIEGFIKEMEQLQADQAAANPPPPPPAPPPPEPTPPPPAPAPEPAATTTTAPGAVLTSTPDTPPADQETTPVTHRWWFWTGIGAVVAGGVVAAVLITRGGTNYPACPMSANCPQGTP
ncbi:MAG TPA: tetratricopeptide repeat protein [Polyangia bacterium]|nr:tetratricopeptide repeat protein [Polyangia bacterium]